MDWPSSPPQSDDNYDDDEDQEEDDDEEEDDVSSPDEDVDKHVSPSTTADGTTIEHERVEHASLVGDFLHGGVAAAVSSATATTPSQETPNRKQPPKPSVASPTQWDCICDRGKGAMNHPGNKRLRRLVSQNLEIYRNSANNTEKNEIQTEIVSIFQRTGRFLQEDKHTGRWYLVDDETARRKIGQVRLIVHVGNVNFLGYTTPAKRNFLGENKMSFIITPTTSQQQTINFSPVATPHV